MLFCLTVCRFLLRPSASNFSRKNDFELGGMWTKVTFFFFRNNVQGRRQMTESEKEVVAK